MKNWLTPVLAGLFAVAALTSCEKDEDKVTITPSNTVALSASATNVVLTQPNSARTAVIYTWTPLNSLALSGTEFNRVPTISYQLQIAKAADGFGNPAIIDAGAGTSKTITVEQLNSALIGMGLTPGTSATVFVRLAAVVGTDNRSFVSNATSITATPYRVCLPPNTDTWGLVGPAGDGWPGATATDRMLTWNCDERAYILRTTLNAGPFKFRKNQDWAVNLGGPTGNYAQGVALVPNGPDMVATAGTYTVKLVVNGSGAAVTGATLTITP